MLFRKQKNKLRTSEEQIKLETLISHPLLGNIELALTNMAKIRFHEIYSNYYYLLEDKNNEYLSNLQIIGLLDADYMQENPFDYLAHYKNLKQVWLILKPCLICYLLHQTSFAQKCLP